ncbi:MAG: hypothetical protein RSE97_04165, partial [Oscillospiraceae bacterium]
MGIEIVVFAIFNNNVDCSVSRDVHLLGTKNSLPIFLPTGLLFLFFYLVDAGSSSTGGVAHFAKGFSMVKFASSTPLRTTLFSLTTQYPR